MSGIPDGWMEYSRIGKQIEGTRFIAFKVPLHSRMSDSVEQMHRLDDKILLREVPNLGMIIDLTNTARYYDPDNFKKHGIEYHKLMVAGHVTPHNNLVKTFKCYVLDFLKSNKTNDKLIGVHCTHGVNRTGYFICNYMVTELGMLPKDAIEKFVAGRGHQIKRNNYVQELCKLGENESRTRSRTRSRSHSGRRSRSRSRSRNRSPTRSRNGIQNRTRSPSRSRSRNEGNSRNRDDAAAFARRDFDRSVYDRERYDHSQRLRDYHSAAVNPSYRNSRFASNDGAMANIPSIGNGRDDRSREYRNTYQHGKRDYQSRQPHDFQWRRSERNSNDNGSGYSNNRSHHSHNEDTNAPYYRSSSGNSSNPRRYRDNNYNNTGNGNGNTNNYHYNNNSRTNYDNNSTNNDRSRNFRNSNSNYPKKNYSSRDDDSTTTNRSFNPYVRQNVNYN